MKKLTVFMVSFCFLLLLSVYIFIPSRLEVSKIEVIPCNINGAYRTLADVNSWKTWWPKKDVKSDFVEKSFFYNGYSYRLANKFHNAVQVSFEKDQSLVNTKINLIKINVDSTVFIWTGQLEAGRNPVKRILNYKEAVTIKENMTGLLSRLHFFLQKKENIYGFNFHRSMSKDSTLVAIKTTTPGFPSTAKIYSLIEDLRNYIADEGAKENNFPMLHVKAVSDTSFETMVAIPVNKELKGAGKIFFSRFVPWYVLTAEVQGGNYTIRQALQQMQLYINDYQKTAMAIPFESLVTNRMVEADTLKWITNIYTPIPF